MYITGNLYTFQQRLHQLPTSGDDLVLFRLESGNYAGEAEDYDFVRWQKEIDKKESQFG